MKDVRWKQRFSNYINALLTLDEACALAQSRPLSRLEQQGLIQGFEFTHELAWNVLKDYLTHQGITGLVGSRDATRSAFANGLIEQGDDWMQMIADRNLSSHTYAQNTAQAIADRVLERYYPAFKQLADRFTPLSEQPDND